MSTRANPRQGHHDPRTLPTGSECTRSRCVSLASGLRARVLSSRQAGCGRHEAPSDASPSCSRPLPPPPPLCFPRGDRPLVLERRRAARRCRHGEAVGPPTVDSGGTVVCKRSTFPIFGDQPTYAIGFPARNELHLPARTEPKRSALLVRPLFPGAGSLAKLRFFPARAACLVPPAPAVTCRFFLAR